MEEGIGGECERGERDEGEERCRRSLVDDDADDALSVLQQRIGGDSVQCVGWAVDRGRKRIGGRTIVRTVKFYCACCCRSLITFLKR